MAAACTDARTGVGSLYSTPEPVSVPVSVGRGPGTGAGVIGTTPRCRGASHPAWDGGGPRRERRFSSTSWGIRANRLSICQRSSWGVLDRAACRRSRSASRRPSPYPSAKAWALSSSAGGAGEPGRTGSRDAIGLTRRPKIPPATSRAG
ncbi:MAG: hypothetical protein L3K08_03455, partial [Thermoplasmata archaeon]|nr:hypothetical protein [Thermoplasmata archaeon]